MRITGVSSMKLLASTPIWLPVRTAVRTIGSSTRSSGTSLRARAASTAGPRWSTWP